MISRDALLRRARFRRRWFRRASPRQRYDEAGLASLELAFLAGVMIGGVLLVSFAWRVTQARADVADAAAEAARAASLVNEADADDAARAAAAASLESATLLCSPMDVATTTSGGSGFEVDPTTQPPGTVVVTISCGVDLSDVSGFAGAGSMTMTAESTEVIDSFRGGSGGEP